MNYSPFLYVADAKADTAVEQIIGPWPKSGTYSPTEVWQRLAPLGQFFAGTITNAELENYPARSATNPKGAEALSAFLNSASKLPSWLDHTHIARGSQIFRQHSSASSVILFCASLPEVYAYNTITDVLMASRQLKENAAHRIKSTAGLVLPIMLDGGLTAPAGHGVTSILKARLRHACVRNFLLKGNPATVLKEHAPDHEQRHIIPGLDATAGEPVPPRFEPFQHILAAPFEIGARGLPINQVEQSYVMSCFSYVQVRGLKKLGIRLSPQDETSIYHTWNAVAHLMGVSDQLMSWTGADARTAFNTLQQMGVTEQTGNDTRPQHARALITTMAKVLPNKTMAHYPEMMIRHLCKPTTLAALGLTHRMPFAASTSFNTFLQGARAMDRVAGKMGIRHSAVGKMIDVMSTRFITDILEMDVNRLRLQLHTHHLPK